VNLPACVLTNSGVVFRVNDPTGAASSYCFTYECTDCTHNPYLTGNEEPAAAGCYWFSECIYGEANTYTVTTYDSGTFTVRARALTEQGCVDSVDITRAVADPLWSYCSKNIVKQVSAYDGNTYGGFTAISCVSSEGRMTWSEANDVCKNKGAGWRLPTQNEMRCVCINKSNLAAVGGYANLGYWTSSAYETGSAWTTDFTGNCYNDVAHFFGERDYVKCVK
jgi:hypothetical protein